MKKKALGMLGLAAAGWVGWRVLSKTRALPCPSQLAWLVEMENPLASAARSTTVIERLQPQPGERIADIGCGPGRLTLPLARAVGHFGEIIALDLQSAMLAKLRAKAERDELSNIRYLQADMASADIEAGSLDGAVLVMALGEMPQPSTICCAPAAASSSPKASSIPTTSAAPTSRPSPPKPTTPSAPSKATTSPTTFTSPNRPEPAPSRWPQWGT